MMDGKTRPQFYAREDPYADRESWEVWDRDTCEIAEPLETYCDLSCGEALRLAEQLNKGNPEQRGFENINAQ